MSQQKIKLASASFIGISSIVGSGWLFAPYVAAHISGPAAILSWTIGTLIIYLLAMCYAEIATLHPIRGLSAVITTLSHNQYFGFPFAIANWLGIVAVIALEADATVQYLVNIVPSWHHLFFDATESMTLIGSLLALVFVIFYTLVNFWGIKLLAKANNLITVIKLAVPVITVIILLCAAFHPHNFTSAGGSFMPYGFTSVIVTILTAGIIVSFNGFQTILSFSSEIHNPTRTIPWALTIAIFVSFILYIVLQVAFIGALPPSFLAHGWDSFNMSAPIVQLVGILGLNFFIVVLYIGAVAAPMGTALAFTGSASRMFTAMARKKQMPQFFDNVHPIYGLSRRSLIFNALLAVVFLFSFNSWSDLAQVLGLFHILSYKTVPLALTVFRKDVKREEYKFRMPFGVIISFILFTIFNILISLGSYKIVFEITVIVLIFQLVFIITSVINKVDSLMQALRKCIFLIIYLATLPMISYISPLNAALLSTVWYFVVIGVYSLVIFIILTSRRAH
ncbi:APC family permease [Fangia hongkongensis]|uniref:APC family permease n=2 Tax=Fangia hongkongensis TaxID=270495 RepID=UPI000378F83F|nr:APC family permease [Fangia hongkongensis]